MRYGHALPQPGRAEFFAGKQAVEHFRTRHARFGFQQQPGLFEQTFFAACVGIEQDMR